ncbi:CBF/Mak21 family-domain-containing protein [Powellomyces hirtus]|nr:CBF/Mak21 family-domain-containing protein [Powellomyces hirtus]
MGSNNDKRPTGGKKPASSGGPVRNGKKTNNGNGNGNGNNNNKSHMSKPATKQRPHPQPHHKSELRPTGKKQNGVVLAAAAAAKGVSKVDGTSEFTSTSASSSSRRAVLLREILSLGGEEADLDLITDALSGSEAEDDNDEEGGDNAAAQKKKKQGTLTQTVAKEKKKADVDVDETALLADLQTFMSMDLKIDPKMSKVVEVDDDEGEWEDADEVEEEEEEGEAEEGQISQEDEDEVEDDDEEEEETVPTLIHSAMDVDAEDDDEGRGADFEFDDQDDDEDAVPADAAKYGKEDTSEVRNMVSQMLQGQTVDDKLSRKLLCDPVSQWHLVPLPPITPPPTTSDADEPFIVATYQRAQSLYLQEVEKYERSKSMSSADRDFIGTVLKSGTVTDKVSALTLLVQESPLHTLAHLRDQLVNGMARKKARREAVMAIDSVKDLLLGTLLPDRKLRYFRDQPLQSKDVKPVHLVSWYFEDGLKKTYYEFIKLIEELARDPLLHVKNKMIQYIFDLLVAKPEQEQNLLALLTNKLGDQDRKLASKSAHLLSRLLLQHPVMKLVVIKEVERLLFRPNISDRARYYAITFLNQIVFSHKEQDVVAANRLIEVYFAVFDGLGKRKMEAENAAAPAVAKKDRWRDAKNKKGGKGGKGKKAGDNNNNKGKGGRAGAAAAPITQESQDALGEVDGIDAKMMAALLTGVNRAFPFAKIEDSVFDTHMATLFRITHIGTFNTSIQSLSLIFQVQSSRQSISDRFYRTLYGTLVDLRLYTASKQAMYLNLLFRAIKADTSTVRVKAFVKRLVQICAVANVPFVCAALFLIGEVAKTRPGIWAMVNLPEDKDEDDVERFVDVLDEEDRSAKEEQEAAAVESADEREGASGNKMAKYDGKKRDPLYCNADSSCLWELTKFATHFHPTVSLYAQTLLSGSSIAPPPNTKNYDPLQNHTLQRFLDRFVFKNPKKVESAYKGASLMQPRVAGLHAGPKDEDRLVSAARKRGVVVQNEDVGTVALDDIPVHLRARKWVEDSADGEDVPVDEAFFYQFFKTKHQVDTAAGKLKAKRKGRLDDDVDDIAMDVDAEEGDAEDYDGSEDGEELGEDEVWNAMRRSAGFADDEDDEDDDEDLMDDEIGEEEEEDVLVGDWSEPESGVESEGAMDMEEVFRKMDGVGEGEEEDGEDDAMAQWAAGADQAGGDSDDDDDVEAEDEDDTPPLGAALDEDVDEDDELDDLANWVTKDEDDALSDSDLSDEDTSTTKDATTTTTTKKKKRSTRMALKAQALGYKGTFFEARAPVSGLGAFASADEFEALMKGEDVGHDDDDDEEEGGGGQRPAAVRKGKVGEKRKRRGSGAGAARGAAKAKKFRKR